jgi:hypothetical protein
MVGYAPLSAGARVNRHLWRQTNSTRQPFRPRAPHREPFSFSTQAGDAMPFDPNSPFGPADPSQWWRTRTSPHILVQPNAPPNGASGNPADDDGIDDWFVPPASPKPGGHPNDWSVPWSAETDALFPNDWIYPDSENTRAPAVAPSTTPPAASQQPNPNPSITSRAPAPFDPFAAYWSRIPASRIGALAWAPPIFPDSFGQFPPAESPPRNDPPSFAPGGLLGAIPRMCAAAPLNNSPSFAPGGLLGAIPKMCAPASATDPLAAAANGILGGIAKLIPPPTPTSGASIDAGQGPFAPMLGAQPAPRFGPTLFSDLPFEAPFGVDDGFSWSSPLGSLAGFAPSPANRFAGTSGFPIFDASGKLLPDPSATPLSTAAAASFARGPSSPAGSALASSNSNPFTRLLNALNPISPANAAEDEGGGLPPALFQALLQGLIDAATAKRLAEQQRFLQEAEEARKDFLEVVQGRASSRALGVALEASGVQRPKGYAAHHIAAGTDERAEFARSALRKFGIGINDAANGVFLPANRATQVIAGETIHSTLHTRAYYDAINQALETATTRQQAIGILRDIAQALQAGDYP